jgi:hypothetical protein
VGATGIEEEEEEEYLTHVAVHHKKLKLILFNLV